jgi:hypothetical protein
MEQKLSFNGRKTRFHTPKVKEQTMNHRLRRPNFFREFGFLAVLTFLFSLAGFSIIMWLFHLFTLNVKAMQDWTLLDGFVSVLTLSFLAGGLVTSVVNRVNANVTDAREKAKLSYDIYQAINAKLTDPEQEAARRWILMNINVRTDDEDFQDWYVQTQEKIMAVRDGDPATGLPEGQRAVKMTLNLLDYIGFIAKNYWDVEDDSLDWLGLPVAKIWRRLGPYILELRRLRNAKDYYVFAEHIGNLCIQWRQSRDLPDEEFVISSL